MHNAEIWTWTTLKGMQREKNGKSKYFDIPSSQTDQAICQFLDNNLYPDSPHSLRVCDRTDHSMTIEYSFNNGDYRITTIIWSQ